MSGESLEMRGITNMDGLARSVPGLIIGEGGGTVQGGTVVLRGISGADSNPIGDQAVSFNVDGVQIARASVRRMAEMDLEQIEVLKGPQALFYGKNSPGGVISMHTANPTDEFAAKIQSGYEFEADEWRTEGFVSAPITDTIGFRLAAYYSEMDGWVDNDANSPFEASPGVFVPTTVKGIGPGKEDYAIRGTLRFEPSDAFDATFKLTYSNLDGDAMTQNVQLVNCPGAAPPNDACKADDKQTLIEFGPGYPLGANSWNEQDQLLSGLTMNYALTDTLLLTSVTGYYDMEIDSAGNFVTSQNPNQILGSANYLEIEELSQEIRLTSDFDGHFNFMVGAYIQESENTAATQVLFGATGFKVLDYGSVTEGDAWSVFAQGMFEMTETLDLSIGLRYSEETKDLTNLESFGAEVQPDIDSVDFTDTSPEITLSWQPLDNTLFYASYKEGFLSGGFNGSSGVAFPALADPTYKPQNTRASLKNSRLLAQ